jgi:hypothetical protein
VRGRLICSTILAVQPFGSVSARHPLSQGISLAKLVRLPVSRKRPDKSEVGLGAGQCLFLV